MVIDFNKLDKSNRYKITSNTVVPRPIAWISTESKDGTLNIAPFSYFTPVSSEPPIMMVSIGKKRNGDIKDTLKNLREIKKCSITIPSYNLTELLNKTASPLEYGVSEFEEFNIKKVTIDSNYPAVPEGAEVIFFAQYFGEFKIDGSATQPIFLKVDRVYLNDSLVKEEEESIKSDIFIDALARVGGRYFKLGEEIVI